MLSISDMETLRDAYSATSDVTLDDAMERIGNPSAATVVDIAVAGLASPDRNTRVLMLRVLQHQHGKIAMRGVCSGLQDPGRRVCAVAIQACPNFMAFPEIVEQLELIAKSMTRKRKLRHRALSMLAGNEGRMRGDLTPAVVTALTRLMTDAEHHFSIVFGLAQLELAPRINTLLEDFARSVDDRERELASRSLAGERVIHIDAYARDEALNRRIMTNCEIAHERMYYWLPRAGLPAEVMPAN